MQIVILKTICSKMGLLSSWGKGGHLKIHKQGRLLIQQEQMESLFKKRSFRGYLTLSKGARALSTVSLKVHNQLRQA